jgi:hypothetical protein
MPRNDNLPSGSPQADEARIRDFLSSLKVDLQPFIKQVVQDELLTLRSDLLTAIDNTRESLNREPAPPPSEPPPRAPDAHALDDVRTARVIARKSEPWRGLSLSQQEQMIIGALVMVVIVALVAFFVTRTEPAAPGISTVPNGPPSRDSSRDVVLELLDAQGRWTAFYHSKDFIDYLARLPSPPPSSTTMGEVLAAHIKNPAGSRSLRENEILYYVLQRSLGSGADPVELLESLESTFLERRQVTLADLKRASPRTADDQWLLLLGRAFVMEQVRATGSR